MFPASYKMAFRSLRKSKTCSILNVFGLAIGIACAGLIFLWVEDEMTFDMGAALANPAKSLRSE